MMDKFWDLLFSPDFNYPTLEQYPYAQVMYEEYQKKLVESIDFVSAS